MMIPWVMGKCITKSWIFTRVVAAAGSATVVAGVDIVPRSSLFHSLSDTPSLTARTTCPHTTDGAGPRVSRGKLPNQFTLPGPGERPAMRLALLLRDVTNAYWLSRLSHACQRDKAFLRRTLLLFWVHHVHPAVRAMLRPHLHCRRISPAL